MISKFDECTGCGACKVACPAGAIEMIEDDEGFYYPEVELNKCVNCFKCDKVCRECQKLKLDSKEECYAVSVLHNGKKELYSSGGAFTALAETFLKMGGYVCGAAYVDDNISKVQHRIICELSELHYIQGSKYVQSDAWVIYKEIFHLLNQGKKVLFSGTPCQVAGLKSYLKAPYSNLVTVEVICHGVPSQKMFKDYLNTLGGSIKEFRFRNKEKGWGYTASVTGNSGRVRYIHRKSSSYYDGFIKGYFLRKSCYACAFASKTRCADITVGDFWGVFKDYKRVLIRNVSKWENGISACIINTDVGHDLFEAASNKINKFKVSFEQISVANYRLLHGDPIPQKRESLMSQYKKWGYNSIEDDFHKHRECGIKVKIKELLPSRIKFLLKCIK